MDSDSPIYKTATLVRDAVGCYYFICLQCGKDFENLEDTVIHIEKYFYESSDDNNVDTPLTNNESDWTANDGDVETVLTNIKKESFEEYEDYQLSIPHEYQGDVHAAKSGSVHCPLCSNKLGHTESSLESHLMTVHNRSKNHAKIYECTTCGRNSFTRSYDLERHQLTHSRCVDPADELSTIFASNTLKRNGDRGQSSVLLNILSQSEKKPTGETIQAPTCHSTPHGRHRPANKRYMSVNEMDVVYVPKKTKLVETLGNDEPIAEKPPSYCSICQAKCSKNESLESHLMRVHRRNKQYAKVYECNVCGKNSFTRPYDLRRHQLIHLTKGRKQSKSTLPNKVVKVEPKSDAQTAIVQVPLAKRIAVKSEETIAEATGVADVKKINAEIRTTDPQKDGILCAICNMKFESYFDVTMHLKFAHNQRRIYKCSHSNCTAEPFTNAFILHRHEMSHSIHYRNIVGNNQNRTKCVFCRRSFNKKWNLMKHEKRHAAEMSKQ